MLLSNARKNNQGFTLIETLTILVIIGILSAIAAPSFLGLLNRGKVSSNLNELQGALQEAQREAMRRSKPCTVELNTTLKAVTAPCLVTGERIFDSSVGLESNGSSIPFDYRGIITLGSGRTFVLFTQESFSNKKCLVISSPLGMIRTGTYTGQIPADTTHPIDGDNCRK